MSSEKPVILNKQQVAYALGVTTNTVNRYQNRKESPLPIRKRGSGRGGAEYDLQEVVDWFVQEEISRRIKVYHDDDAEQPAVYDKELEQARLFRAQAESYELKNALSRKELAPISLIEWTLGNVCKQISATLASIPQKVKRRAPKLGAKEIEIIAREIKTAQNAAARVTVDFDEYSPDNASRSE